MKVIVKGDKKMRKRFNVFWRIAVVLLVVTAIASVAISSDTTQAAGTRTQRPNTYLDPIPDRINDAIALVGGWISGTTLEGATGAGYDVVDVEVMIVRNVDGWCWDDTTTSWLAVEEWWNPVGGIVQEAWTTDQWIWGFPPAAPYNPGFIAGDLVAGWSYTVYARAVDADDYEDLTPATDTFIYDDEPPDVSYVTNLPLASAPLSRIYSLTEIKGGAHDDCGDLPGGGIVQQVRLAIEDMDNGVWWNGFFWQPDPVWIKAQGTSSWSISTTTNPPLPEWQNNLPADSGYSVWVQVGDNADNRDFDPGIAGLAGPGFQFLYRKQLTSEGCYLDQLPAWANSNPALGSYWRFMDPAIGFTGTAKALPLQDIDYVEVEIKDATDNVYWDDVAVDWAGSVTFANCPIDAAPVQDVGFSNQWDWTVPVPGALTWQQGHRYEIRAQATDDSGTPKTYISSTESFTFDDILPYSSNIHPFDDIVYNVWNSLTGNCQDDTTPPNPGKIAAEVILIQRAIDSLYWNGFSWGDTEWNSGDIAGEWDWIYAAANGGSFGQNAVEWKVTDTTEYPLPPLVNGEDYTITAMSFDNAGNEESTDTKDFTFRIDLSGYTAPTATTGPTSTNTSGPTATATATGNITATASSTTATATATVPTATKTPTATPTTVPGFSGSDTIGAGGGSVGADDSSGNPRITADFDSGAFSDDTDVTIEGSGSCSGIGAAPSGYSYGNSCFDIEPSGDLGAPVEVCVYYTAADEGAGGGDPANLTLAYKNSGGNWVILDTTVDEGAGTLCTETTHIGTFAVLGKAAAEGGEWEWWYYLLIGLGALLIIAIIVLILIRPKGGEGEEAAEEGYEEEEEI